MIIVKETSRYNTALVVLGFTTILSQLVIIREFLNLFEGNELIIGLIFCTWMLLTATGSVVAKKINPAHHTIRLIRLLLLLESLFPIIVIMMLYLMESWLFPPGTAKGLTAVVLFSVALLMPGCVTAGMLFTLLAAAVSQKAGENRISASYGWESLGSILAGILFSLGLAFIFRTFQLLGLLVAVNLVFYLFVFTENKIRSTSWLISLLVALAVVLAILSEGWIQSNHYKGQNLVYWKNTPYGNITVTATSGQYSIYENSTFLFSTHNSLWQEEAVHFALLQQERPEHVMIVSGGLKGMTDQALKYATIGRVDYVEINPWLLQAEGLFSEALSSDRVNIIIKDARKQIRGSTNAYDAIIVNAPDPSSAQLNRYFTLEFFREAKQALRDGGVLEIALSATGNYINEEALVLNGMIAETLHRVFKSVEVIPGERNYYVASDYPVETDIARRVQDAGLVNDYVNPFYIDDDLLRQRSEEIMNQISPESHPVNTDLAPLAYFMQIRQWMLKSEGQRQKLILVLVGFALLLGILLLLLRGVNSVTLGVFAGAFAGASAEFLLLILFQVLFGFIYLMLGVIVACYMGGLTAGSMIRISAERKKMLRGYVLVQMVLLLLILAIPVFAYAVVNSKSLPGGMILSIICLLTAGIAWATGLIFNLASRLESGKVQKTAGTLYGIDLAGAAAGTLVTAMVLLPLTGLMWTCVMIGGLTAMSTITVFSRLYLRRNFFLTFE